MTKTIDGKFEVTVDDDGTVTIQPIHDGFSADEVVTDVSSAAGLAGVLMGEVIKYEVAKAFKKGGGN